MKESKVPREGHKAPAKARELPDLFMIDDEITEISTDASRGVNNSISGSHSTNSSNVVISGTNVDFQKSKASQMPPRVAPGTNFFPSEKIKEKTKSMIDLEGQQTISLVDEEHLMNSQSMEAESQLGSRRNSSSNEQGVNTRSSDFVFQGGETNRLPLSSYPLEMPVFLGFPNNQLGQIAEERTFHIVSEVQETPINFETLRKEKETKEICFNSVHSKGASSFHSGTRVPLEGNLRSKGSICSGPAIFPVPAGSEQSGKAPLSGINRQTHATEIENPICSNAEMVFAQNEEIFNELAHSKESDEREVEEEIDLGQGLSNEDQIDEVLFEIPECPICFEKMVGDLVAGPCGHVLHSFWYSASFLPFTHFVLSAVSMSN